MEHTKHTPDFRQAAEDWFAQQKYSLGNIPNWNMEEEIKRAYWLGMTAQYNKIPELIAALETAKLQIQYLHEKFTITGSGAQVLAKIETALQKAKP